MLHYEWQIQFWGQREKLVYSRANHKNHITLPAVFRFDLWSQPLYPFEREMSSKSKTLTGNTSTCRMVISLPVVLTCNLTLLACPADMQRGITEQTITWTVICVRPTAEWVSAPTFVSREENQTCETPFRCWFHCRVYKLKLSSGTNWKFNLSEFSVQGRQYYYHDFILSNSKKIWAYLPFPWQQVTTGVSIC